MIDFSVWSRNHPDRAIIIKAKVADMGACLRLMEHEKAELKYEVLHVQKTT
jgi:hypothetical protein